MEKKHFLNKAEIMQAQDLEARDVHVPQWGGWLRVRGLTGIERGKYMEDMMIGKGQKKEVTFSNLHAKLVARSVVDEQNNRLFSDKEIGELGRKSAAALQKVFDVAAELSGLSGDQIKELEENLGEIPSVDSGSN